MQPYMKMKCLHTADKSEVMKIKGNSYICYFASNPGGLAKDVATQM